MRLDRNVNPDGSGKYALVRLRPVHQMGEMDRIAVTNALAVLKALEVLDYGEPGSVSEFFPIRLRDRFSQAALMAYADAAQAFDPEYAAEVRLMAERAGPAHPLCKTPD